MARMGRYSFQIKHCMSKLLNVKTSENKNKMCEYRHAECLYFEKKKQGISNAKGTSKYRKTMTQF